MLRSDAEASLDRAEAEARTTGVPADRDFWESAYRDALWKRAPG
jgi:hypothetical protein